MKKFYTELAYLLGIAGLACGTALMSAADFGMASVVAPAYVLYAKLSQVLPWFSFGIAEYALQAVVLLLLVIVLRKFRWRYLFAFATALFYGVLLDGAMWLLGLVPAEGLGIRIVFLLLGMGVSAVGVSLLFHTYIAPEVYELFVKEVSLHFHLPMDKCKVVYDCVSCVVAIGMSFAFFGFGQLEGIGIATVLCAVLNGFLIGGISKFLEKRFTFADAFKKA